MKAPTIGTHLATLNLFREGPDHCEITVAAAQGATGEMTPRERDETRPIDYVEPLIVAAADRMRLRIGAAIPMVLHCPKCGTQHIDEPDAAKGWTNPPHRSHECQRCGTIWRPSDLPTIGVEAIATAGKADNWTVGEGVTLNGLRVLAGMRLEQAIHECQNVPLYERGDYLARAMAKVAGALFLREPRDVREICEAGPAQA